MEKKKLTLHGVEVGCQLSRSACLCTGGGIVLRQVLSKVHLFKKCQAKPRKKNLLAPSSYKQDAKVIMRSVVVKVPFLMIVVQCVLPRR